MSEERVRKLRAKANRTDNPHERDAFHAKADAIEAKLGSSPARNAGRQFQGYMTPGSSADYTHAGTTPDPARYAREDEEEEGSFTEDRDWEEGLRDWDAVPQRDFDIREPGSYARWQRDLFG